MIKLSLIGGCARDNMRKVWPFLIAIILTITVIPIIIDIAPPAASATIWYVDDIPGGSPPEDFTTIQEAVDAAQPGDTVFVWNGTYYEDVEITKTINLTGESRDSTIINGSGNGWCVYSHNADYINISGFTMENSSTGLSLAYSNNSLIIGNKVIKNKNGIALNYVNESRVINNIASNSTNDQGIHLYQSTNIEVDNNICDSNAVNGIYLQDSQKNLITNNNCSNNYAGISTGALSIDNVLIGNTVKFNSNRGLGIFSDNNTFIGNIMISNNIGVKSNALVGDTNRLINCSILSSSTDDINMGFVDNLILLNTTFNASKTSFQGTLSIIDVQWYLHINL